MISIKASATLALLFVLQACNPLNTPYPDDSETSNTLYSSFQIRPKHLDPARSYSSDEYVFIGQIYEPPLQYDYLKRPYQLIPLTAERVPVSYLQDIDGKMRSVYDIEIQPGIYYAPHPAFEGKRELTASDYIYQIKRIADPKNQSPIRSLMAAHIYGFQDFSKQAKDANDLLSIEMKGIQMLSRYKYRIILNAPYPQFIYWLALPFFSPMPPEIIAWHASPERGTNHHGIDWYPIGTGAYQLTTNNPNREMVLERNPNYRKVYYPNTKEQMPFIDRVVFKLEKESIPYWQKFLQGYYDASGVGSDQFDQALRITSDGDFELSEKFNKLGISLNKNIEPSIFYFGFNMLDETIGGYTPAKKALRQAIAIAVDYEEMISIFANGRGKIAHAPLPPGIFGQREGESGINPITHQWKDDKAQRHNIEKAKKLLVEAGYPNGIDPKTGKQLILHLDVSASGPDSRPRLNWMHKQFAKLNIEMVVRSTDYNRFREKITKGNAQMFEWGWNADYPDPENFLFLLFGPNSKVSFEGENATNYNNEQFNRLFKRMTNLPNNAERQEVIDRMVNILREDSPWLWGWHPLRVSIYHQWLSNMQPNPMVHNNLQYRKLDPYLRVEKRNEWNNPRWFPLWFLLLGLTGSIYYAYLRYKKRQLRKINVQ